jgi:uncharacterized phage protein (TIGR02218 family)
MARSHRAAKSTPYTWPQPTRWQHQRNALAPRAPSIHGSSGGSDGRAIAEGDAFIIRAGCDKRIETCGVKFANTVNFRGFPHIPGQDAVLRYATTDGGHDGEVL